MDFDGEDGKGGRRYIEINGNKVYSLFEIRETRNGERNVSILMYKK